MNPSFPGIYSGLRGFFRFESKNKIVDSEGVFTKNDNPSEYRLSFFVDR